MKRQNIHPFPARMAPDIALDFLHLLKPNSVVLDPMSGSGTVVREAAKLGHRALGYDMDPLAVLISTVSTTSVKLIEIEEVFKSMLEHIDNAKEDVFLPWIDNDPETANFIRYWFADSQIKDLRKISSVIYAFDSNSELKSSVNIAKIALSRIIITKEQRASLARDTSHSRPHRVSTTNDYNVRSGFEKSFLQLVKLIPTSEYNNQVEVRLGDARKMGDLLESSVDAVVTSPPYLNAIDYLRGHRMSLVWLGYSLKSLRSIRSNSIGAERILDAESFTPHVEEIVNTMGDLSDIPKRNLGFIKRYALDSLFLMKDVSRVLRSTGTAVFVVGDSCVKGSFVSNSSAIISAARVNGLMLSGETIRELPLVKRYLPLPSTTASSLGKRMRTENILLFSKI